MTTFGAWLSGARADAGLSREQVLVEPGLRALGVTLRRIRAWEGVQDEELPDLVEWAELSALYGLDGDDVAVGLRLARRQRTGSAEPYSPGPVVMPPSPRFAAWLRTTMAARRASLPELAKKLAGCRGVTVAQVSAWMTGVAAPDAAQWSLLSDALGLFAHEAEAGLLALLTDRQKGGG